MGSYSASGEKRALKAVTNALDSPLLNANRIDGAQNVVLLTDLSENTMKAYEKNPDDENRLFYVGATRTK